MKQRIKQWILRHKLPTFLTGVILLAFVLVMISMEVYYRSGAYQLDLSRPEWMARRAEIDEAPKTRDAFDAQGEITVEVLDEFLERYKEEAGRAIDTGAFSADVLSNEELGI